MALVCNTQTQISNTQSKAYVEREGYIESGSAYFSQAFAEALSLICDVELHNRVRAGLRLRSMAFYLEHALKQYRAAVEFGRVSGLNEYHDGRLREAGLDFEGARRVLNEARRRGFLRADDERDEVLARTFERRGCSGVMSDYMGKVEDIRVLTRQDHPGDDDAVAWQELSWKLTTLFVETLEIGKAIAVLNTLTFRLVERPLASEASRSR